ncbi:esterase [Flammeovirga yaeyamensis]|uniref:Esterase n=1 Tax=Flammeovirga yaeyamensis TaxID=367791 RepID=A0AAX1N3E2_9BACT|nr:alpha/beta hydrolase-fold protein [Flammeovirga yaeyamensis]MBB3700973.1 enterochelin esterase-like enzyme [Flammeovirga yaeyamensis]NMF38193.1 alpha/beta hydrolase [Flammeovirga yaeyamensis]QWG01962.1 esterase [Flammeovirga yaeyamensis]
MKKLFLILLAPIVLFSCSSTENKTETKSENKKENKLSIGEASQLQIPKVVGGEIERIESFKSKYIDDRLVDVYLPEGYSSDKKYSVLYMHDGLMLFDSTITWNKQEWQVDEHITKLLEENKIEDVIVVAVPNNGKYRSSEYLPQKSIETLDKALHDKVVNVRMAGKAISDNYLKFLTEELKPYIDNKYPTLSDRDHTFVMGSSMGGLISLYAICEYPDVFGGAGCLSTHWPMIFPDKFTEEELKLVTDGIINYADKNLPDPKTHKIYFDYGTETLDAMYEPYQLRINEVMKKHKFDNSNWITKKFPGQNHSERAWDSRLDIPLVFLMGK